MSLRTDFATVGQAAAGLAAVAPPSTAPAAGEPRGIFPMRTPSVAAPITTASVALTYYGGPVVQNPKVVVVYWNASIDGTVTSTVGAFYKDILQSPYLDGLSEYGTLGKVGPGGATTNQGISRGTFAGAYTLAPSRCTGTYYCSLTDGQIQNELLAQIRAGKLPTPTRGCDGNTDTIYMIDFPANTSITSPDGTHSCTAGGFCGYHGTTRATVSGINVVYGVVPYVGLVSACASACGNGSYPDVLTTIHSHELVESITDPKVGVASTFSPPLAWYDQNNGEVADICAGQQGTISVGANSWTVQMLWSIGANACVTAAPAAPICTGPNTPAGCRPCACSDDGIGCSGGTPVCETSAGDVKAHTCVECTTNAQCTAPATCQKSASPAIDDTCSCVARTQCPVGQNCGTAPDGCGGIINCGTCPAPYTCGGGGPPNQCGCTPNRTCPAGQTCGTASDGCGGIINCGTCIPPQTCGGAGTPNQCGCPGGGVTCAPGQNCGTIPDGCGGLLDCGTCAAPETCGGGGNPLRCGCTPSVACPLGVDCGTVPDGCGGTLDCGTCTAPLTCGGDGTANHCGCSALTCSAGRCGVLPDGCGGTLDCGACNAPETCGGNGTANRCGCTPHVACDPGLECGTVGDGCGGQMTCGTCKDGESCASNHCVRSTVDAGGTDGSSDDAGAFGDASTLGSDASVGDPDGGDILNVGTLELVDPKPVTDTAGCGCRVAGNEKGNTGFWGAGALVFATACRARRRRRG